MKTLAELKRTVLHAGPISTIILISTITLSVIYCSLMWWPPHRSIGGLISLAFFTLFSGLTMYHFFAAIWEGPGFISLNWKPADESACSKLQYCTHCKGYKAPRAHHCRRCNRCVLKLDHHCPWINECVGHRNHAHFIWFLLSATIGCSYASFVLTSSVYHAVYLNYYMHFRMKDVPVVHLELYGFLWCVFSLGCAFGVAMGVGTLFYYQARVVHWNQTSVEDWILEKAEYRRKIDPSLPPFVNPYNLGWKRNWGLVLNMYCEPAGDGINWPVIPGCDQYTLTEEQLNQKQDKRNRSRECTVIEDYSGSWFPVSKGVGTFFHPPCNDESRIPLEPGQRIIVSRWKKYWLYGELINDRSMNGSGDGIGEVKGWFPRRCAAYSNNIHRPDCANDVEEDVPASTLSESGDTPVNAKKDN